MVKGKNTRENTKITQSDPSTARATTMNEHVLLPLTTYGDQVSQGGAARYPYFSLPVLLLISHGGFI